ncbi:MAG: hypothetical protein COA78_20490 [Blastopirellula sp.]|nr:MAG: hypothetical protein COA78_20490 [Blastopirellula sp.]
MTIDKIIFLDIDGPMIPTTSILLDRNASWSQTLDGRCVRVLHLILKKSGAKVVFNSTHNRMLYDEPEGLLKIMEEDGVSSPGLVKRFIDAGFEDYLHSEVCTIYPDLDRLAAINLWLSENGSTEDTLWVAFDDVFLNDDRAYLTSYSLGIGSGEYNHAAFYLGFK